MTGMKWGESKKEKAKKREIKKLKKNSKKDMNR